MTTTIQMITRPRSTLVVTVVASAHLRATDDATTRITDDGTLRIID